MTQFFKKKDQISKEIKIYKEKGKTIGFVPTMGSIHEGHLSLVKQAKKENDLVVVSIFVNPIQFDNKDDYKNYPRSEEADTQSLRRANCDIIFMPSEEEMYPKGDKEKIKYKIGDLAKKLEGKFRKGHFSGVITIVQKLFDIVNPDKAYFGQKDYQQYLIIDKYVKDNKLPIEIVLCPTVREKDGLAASSRNILLKSHERKSAAILYKTLNRARIKLNSQNIQDVKTWAMKYINSYPNIEAEYVEIVNAKDLSALKTLDGAEKAVICAAVNVGGVRLIDNIMVN